MKKKQALSETDIEIMVVGHLEEMGIDTGTLNIELVAGSRVFLKGEVPSEEVRNLVIKTVAKVPGIKNVVDELIVTRDLFDDDYDESGERDIHDEDDDFVGTEDLYRSIEDGVPYIPPSSASYRMSTRDKQWKRKSRRRD